MAEPSTRISQSASTHRISYGYGQSSLGDFLTAIDDNGVCAILLGDDRAVLLCDLQVAFPNSRLEDGSHSGPCGLVADAVASLIEQPAAPLAFPTSIRGGDFEQMVYAALKQTKPGTTVTLRIPTMPSRHTELKASTRSDLMPSTVLR